jgi:hypothetical protein
MRLRLATSILICLFSWQTATAQGSPALDPATRAQRKAKAAERAKKMRETYRTETAKEASIPYLPSYPNKKSLKLIRALKYPSLGGGISMYVETYAVKEPADSVRDWYKQALVGSGWIVKANNGSGTQIVGNRSKEGATVTISVSGSPDKGKPTGKDFKTQLQIKYQQVPVSL